MGDFHQFPPVNGRALWEDASEDPDEIRGKSLWSNFTSVFTLTQQMRQRNDPIFQSLLGRARRGELNIDDVQVLNSRVSPTQIY